MAEILRIRAATAADRDALVELALTAYAEYMPGADAERWRGWRDDIEATTRDRAPREGLVAVEGSDIRGSVLALEHADHVELRILAVHPAARGRGIGRRLVEAVLDRARGRDLPEVLLHTTTMMPAALHLYESLGFSRDPEADRVAGSGVRLLALRRAV
jgi:ribosomal protein S18 acetylase RimI-like enzyme